MSLKPWREVAVPHQDVLKGTFQQAEFAADISRVHSRSASAEYQDAALFFQRTYITEGMALLLHSVVQRLAGKGGDPVIQLQTAFGGGKTHTMLAVLHLARGEVAASELSDVPAILDRAGVLELPRARVAVLDGIKLTPGQPRREGKLEIRTLWGELAWQLGGADAYAELAQADAAGASPGKEVLEGIIRAAAPCVLLIDELVAYFRQLEDNRTLPGGTYDANLSFVQALTEGIKGVPNAVLLASLPESEREAGSQRGVAALHALEHYFGRVQAIWKPVASEEAFEIVRRRLFTEIRDRSAADAVCRAFADLYVIHGGDLPGETQEGKYLDRMRAAYPIHPELFDRLYSDWSSLPSFQRTRGVLKLMARVIHRLWQDGNQDLMILPASLPLADPAVSADLVAYLPPGWDPVIERDIDGPKSEPVRIEDHETKFGTVQACRRVTRTIFLGSAPSAVSELARGLETQRMLLGCLQPDQAPHVYRDALTRLENRLTYLSKGNDRWWFDVKPTLRREAEERKRRFGDDEVQEAIRKALGDALGASGPVDGVHYFTGSADVPDDWGVRLVVLPPSAAWTRSGPNPARDAAAAILRNRGEQPRLRPNRLLFLAADHDQVMHLRETVRSLLAWKSIVLDVRDGRITLDNLQARIAEQSRDQADKTVYRLARETYRYLLAPTQGIRKDSTPDEVEWEAFTVNPAAQSMSREIESVLRENELVIEEWAPIHLRELLRRWFWRDDQHEIAATDVWQKTCTYLYFPRLRKSTVLQNTIAAGAASRDFFGLAYGKDDGRYTGFMLGKATAPVMESLLLIEPDHAAEYEAEHVRQERARPPEPDGDAVGPGPGPGPGPKPPHPVPPPTGTTRPTRFYGTVSLDPDKGALQFAKVAEEVIGAFTQNPGTRVRIRVDIQAEDGVGFDEGTTRTVRENARVLGFEQSEFD